MKSFIIFFVCVWTVACTTPDQVKKEVVVIEPDTDTSEEGTVVEDTESDTGSVFDNFHATVEYCSTKIVFNFDGEKCTAVVLENYNDVAVIINIDNMTTGGVVLQNCLWPKNSIFGGEDEEEVNFSSLDNLELEIWLGKGISADICSESVGELFDSFDLCEGVTHDITFIFK